MASKPSFNSVRFTIPYGVGNQEYLHRTFKDVTSYQVETVPDYPQPTSVLIYDKTRQRSDNELIGLGTGRARLFNPTNNLPPVDLRRSEFLPTDSEEIKRMYEQYSFHPELPIKVKKFLRPATFNPLLSKSAERPPVIMSAQFAIPNSNHAKKTIENTLSKRETEDRIEVIPNYQQPSTVLLAQKPGQNVTALKLQADDLSRRVNPEHQLPPITIRSSGFLPPDPLDVIRDYVGPVYSPHPEVPTANSLSGIKILPGTLISVQPSPKLSSGEFKQAISDIKAKLPDVKLTLHRDKTLSLVLPTVADTPLEDLRSKVVFWVDRLLGPHQKSITSFSPVKRSSGYNKAHTSKFTVFA